MGDDSGKAPDIWEEAQKWIYAQFGLRGLAFVALLGGIFYLWTHWEDFKKWPGVSWLHQRFTRDPIPKADPA